MIVSEKFVVQIPNTRSHIFSHHSVNVPLLKKKNREENRSKFLWNVP
jgi:hypothetical protein